MSTKSTFSHLRKNIIGKRFEFMHFYTAYWVEIYFTLTQRKLGTVLEFFIQGEKIMQMSVSGTSSTN
jgi:hypothetical protein